MRSLKIAAMALFAGIAIAAPVRAQNPSTKLAETRAFLVELHEKLDLQKEEVCSYQAVSLREICKSRFLVAQMHATATLAQFDEADMAASNGDRNQLANSVAKWSEENDKLISALEKLKEYTIKP